MKTDLAENKSTIRIMICLSISFFLGMALASFDGFVVYVIGYTMLWTAVGMAIILYIYFTIGSIGIPVQSPGVEIAEYLGKTEDGKRPVMTKKFTPQGGMI
jgi:hypothetical protein